MIALVVTGLALCAAGFFLYVGLSVKAALGSADNIGNTVSILLLCFAAFCLVWPTAKTDWRMGWISGGVLLVWTAVVIGFVGQTAMRVFASEETAAAATGSDLSADLMVLIGFYGAVLVSLLGAAWFERKTPRASEGAE
ncbi:MAG: hypothetical protein AB3N21_16505 [Ruegeria sp.]|uniref:hypothetical protein n=1 Tax=Ruegeria sp. TaxID=1879320 RepID=UPI00349ECD5B